MGLAAVHVRFTKGVAMALAAGAALLASCGPGRGGASPDGSLPSGHGTGHQASADNEWPFYRGDARGESFVDQPMSVAQARALKVAWTYQGAGSVANPVVAGGTAYVTSSNGTLVALDAATGKERWSAPIGVTPKGACNPFVGTPIGAPAVVGPTVFVPGGDAAVHAFRADSGEPIWSTSIGDAAVGDFLWTSAFPLHGRIYVGV